MLYCGLGLDESDHDIQVLARLPLERGWKTQSPSMYDSAELDRNIVPIDYYISGASKAYSRTCQS